MSWLIRKLIICLKRRASHSIDVVTKAGDFSFHRYEPFWTDEYVGSDGKHWNRPPWYRPFNILLHHWSPRHGGEEFHDHPRWSITICLKGSLIERTPWEQKVLTPGSVVIRTRKAIHGFYVPKRYCNKTWTIFIVGRRNHRQNRFEVIPYK